MKKVVHRSGDRGHANHGWLDTYHTFSFANWHNPKQMNFGVLRVLNDDVVAPGMGFGQHPHADMEIISIPLRGSLTHRDTMGHSQEIRTEDVQVMSAGTGLQHSEMNGSATADVNFLQLWIFPEARGVEPRYDQASFDENERVGQWQQLVRPKAVDGEGLWINQSAYMSRVVLAEGESISYSVKEEGNGVYFFIIDGDVQVSEESLAKRDGIGVWEASELSLKAGNGAEVLAIEVPMQLPNYF